MAVCVGCAFEVVDGVLEAKLDPAGHITCGDAGLAVTIPAQTDPNISADACNGIKHHTDGLYAPCPTSVSGGVASGSAQQGVLPVTIIGAADNEWAFESDLISIHNPYCCDVSGRISVQCGGLYIDMATGFRGYARVEVNIAGAGYLAAFPQTNKLVQNNGTGTFYDDLNNIRDDNYLVVGAGATVTYRATYVFHATTGDATLHGTAGFEFVYHLSQVCNCT